MHLLEYFGINIKPTKIAMMMLTSNECAKDITRWEVSLRANLHAPEEGRISCHKKISVL